MATPLKPPHRHVWKCVVSDRFGKGWICEVCGITRSKGARWSRAVCS